MPVTSASTLRLAAGLSGHPDALRAAQHVCDSAAESLGDGVTDLAMLFVSAPSA